MSSEINKVTDNKISQMLNDFQIFEDYEQLLSQIINSSSKQEKNQHESQSPFNNQNQKIIQQKQESKMTPQNKKTDTVFNEICSPTTKKEKRILLQIDQNSTSQKNRQKKMDFAKISNDQKIQNFYKENQQENFQAIFSQQQNCLSKNNDIKNSNNNLSQLSISEIYNQNIEKLSKNDMQEFFKALTFQISQDTSYCSSKNGSSTQSQNLYGYANFLQNMQNEHQNLNFSTQKNEQDKENQYLQKLDQKTKQESQQFSTPEKLKELQDSSLYDFAPKKLMKKSLVIKPIKQIKLGNGKNKKLYNVFKDRDLGFTNDKWQNQLNPTSCDDDVITTTTIEELGVERCKKDLLWIFEQHRIYQDDSISQPDEYSLEIESQYINSESPQNIKNRKYLRLL